MIDDPNRPPWTGNYFTGMPAPGGAIAVLLPIYLYFLFGAGRFAPLVFVYTLAIAFLMVSRIPVFSGKRVGKRVAPEMVLPVFVFVVLFFALLVAYPWWVLTIGTLLYLGSLPFGWMSYRANERRWTAANAAPAPAPAHATAVAPGPTDKPAAPLGPAEPPADPERPARLN
jgi:CDP-diacylglycerol--serine O-phosphatidyltransferase